MLSGAVNLFAAEFDFFSFFFLPFFSPYMHKVLTMNLKVPAAEIHH